MSEIVATNVVESISMHYLSYPQSHHSCPQDPMVSCLTILDYVSYTMGSAHHAIVLENNINCEFVKKRG